ncbi:uncharacterized protein tent5d [Synchiropus picturatus]
MPQQQGSSMTQTKPSQRFHCLKAEQVEVLHQVLSNVVPIHGRGNFPTLELRPRDIIIAVRARLQRQGITVRDVRLNGSTASHVLVRDNGCSYKDLDIIFGVELPSQEEFQVIKESVLGCLLDCLPPGVNRERISSATMKEAYVQKMVKVFNEHDRWSLISLSNNSGKNLELKFVSSLRRQFEFSVDSFQIILDRLLESYMQQEALHRQKAVDQKKDTSPQKPDTDGHPPDRQAESETTASKGPGEEKGNGIGGKEPSERDPESEPQKDALIQTDETRIDAKEELRAASQTELEERSDARVSSETAETSEQTESCDDHARSNPPPAQHEEPVEDSKESESAKPCQASPEDVEPRLDQPSSLETEAPSADEGLDERRQEASQASVDCSAPAAARADDTQAIDCLCSSSLTPHNAQQTGAEEKHSSLNTQTSDKSLVHPLDAQDSLAAPSGLATDKKTSCSASERLSHMVVLKHSSPKPPRRMCRKVAASSHTSSEVSPPRTEPSSGPRLDEEPGVSSAETQSDPVSSKLDSGSDPSPDAAPALEPSPAVPPDPSESCETLGPEEASDGSGADETASQAQNPDPLETLDALLLSGSSSDTQDHTLTSPDQPDPERPQTDPSSVSAQETLIASPPSFDSVIPQVSCLTPPILSLSPPCLSPSPPSLSPPPCLTPPSHSSPMLSAFSPATSFSSPPLSFSPTSSGLSSPPYLTPPMLSLSPPPLCLTPPSPCLSPPLLCLTPPKESEDFIPQVCSTTEPLILNPDHQEEMQLADDGGEQDQVSLQVAHAASFPVTIPDSSIHPPPPSQPVGLAEAAPVLPAEAPSAAVTEQSGPIDAVPAVEVLAESMYGDFDAAMDHLRYRLIATRNPEEIRGGGLLKYSNLLVRDYRPASETQIKTLERYMCSRFFIDFPDVQEQQRKILSYLKNHFIGEERSKYQYLMTLRRVVDNSTVCLMGHERRQTLNMITVLALKVLGEQNIIPNTDHVTCFYQPAPYLAEHSAPYITEPSYCSYYIPPGGSTLLYQPYPLHLHTQTGLV